MNRDNVPDAYTVEANDPHGELAIRFGLDPQRAKRVGNIMTAMARLRDVEKQIIEASQRYMQLKKTDMRALHFLITRENLGITATPSMLAAHLGITTASTTKLLDRLEKGGHITRSRHPEDRRAITLAVSPETRTTAESTMGKHESVRLKAASQLSADECAVITDFLNATADDIERSLHGEDPPGN